MIYFFLPTETALTMAVNVRYSRDLIMTLVEGGALLDYRNRSGATALHRAAQFGNKEAVQVNYTRLTTTCTSSTSVTGQRIRGVTKGVQDGGKSLRSPRGHKLSEIGTHYCKLL